MGRYVNPGNRAFSNILRGEYVDKTGLAGLVNAAMYTPAKLILSSRPRRFGKSYAAQMLSAYYSCGCDSRSLFDRLDIAESPSFLEHLNQHNVVKLDMTDVLARAIGTGFVPMLTSLVMDDLRAEFPHARKSQDITDALYEASRESGRGFVFIIDEWDAPIREARSDNEKWAYIAFLRSLFKNINFTGDVVDAAYMTGILPLKRYNTQSALSEFREYTMLEPWRHAPYVGFTEREVRQLCEKHEMSFEETKRWYDGYELAYQDGNRAQHVRAYAPFSVMRAVESHRFGSYWTSTTAYESLLAYIDRDFDGLQQQMARLVSGERLPVNPLTFGNDMREVNSADDVLTLLVHLGYLAFDGESVTVRIPNEEVRREFVATMRRGAHPVTGQLISSSDKLLRAAIEGDEEAVAAGVQAAHDSRLGPDWYNDEQALRFAVKLAFLTAVDTFAEIEELPSGHGRADIVYIPKRHRPEPAMLVELKWDREPRSAFDQIRNRNYPKALRDYGGPLLLVGVTYDAKTKEHRCHIERMTA